MNLTLTVLLICLLPAALSWKEGCITEPVGFGAGTTGGAGGTTVTPKTIEELTEYLGDNKKRIIILDKDYDYTESEGWDTATGCFFQKCGGGFQESLAHAGTCDGRPPTKVKYSKAGTTSILVGSDKTIMGKNGKGSIKGKGLMIKDASNVIIRDLKICDINPQVIWAGDALAFHNAKNVWVHNVVFENVGRQFLVSYQKPNTGITVSSCTFDGTTKYSAYCNNHHYWVWLFWGTDDQITLINNRIINTSGRLPHAGGWKGSKNVIHMVGNKIQSNSHICVEPYQGSYVLVEGNDFVNAKAPLNTDAKGGQVAFVDSSVDAAQCKKYFGENCKLNTFTESPAPKRVDVGVLSQLSKFKTAINEARAACC